MRPSTTEADSFQGNTRLTGITILLVDDCSIHREVANNILANEGAIVESVIHGQAALDALSEHPRRFNAILMDIQMPVMDGYEAARRIRMVKDLSHLPLIGISAGTRKNEQHAAMAAGMTTFLPKPFDPEILVRTLLKFVHRDVSRLSKMANPTCSSINQEPAKPDGNVKEYDTREAENHQKYLRIFAVHYATYGQKIGACIRLGDLIQANELAHKLIGTASSLGLHEVERVARAVNIALISDECTNEDCLALQAALNQVIDSIQ